MRRKKKVIWTVATCCGKVLAKVATQRASYWQWVKEAVFSAGLKQKPW